MLDALKTIDSRTWIGIIAAGSALCGVVLANVTNIYTMRERIRSENDRDRTKRRQEKLEELYLLLGKWANTFSTGFLKLSLVLKGHIDYNKYLDMVIEDGEKIDLDYGRIEMIINIYAREIKDEYNSVQECRSLVNDLMERHKAEYKAGIIDGEKYLAPMTDAHLVLQKSIDELREKLAILASGT